MRTLATIAIATAIAGCSDSTPTAPIQNQSVDVRDEQIESLQDEIVQKNVEISSLMSTIGELRRDLNVYDQKIRAIRNSPSGEDLLLQLLDARKAYYEAATRYSEAHEEYVSGLQRMRPTEWDEEQVDRLRIRTETRLEEFSDALKNLILVHAEIESVILDVDDLP